MNLQLLAEKECLKQHFFSTIELSNYFDNICFYHFGGIGVGIVKELQVDGKFLRYLELSDGCICPTSFFRLPICLTKNIPRFIKSLENSEFDWVASEYFNINNSHGYIFNKSKFEAVKEWIPPCDYIKHFNIVEKSDFYKLEQE